MTGVELAAFAVVLLALASVTCAIVCGVPFVARLLFRVRVKALHDQVMDDVIAGRLADLPCVRHFLHELESFQKNFRHITWVRALNLHAAMRKTGFTPPTEPSFGHLEPEQRKMMHRYQEQLVTHVESLMLTGSVVGWIVLAGRIPMRWVLRIFHTPKPRHVPNTGVLAVEYTAVHESDLFVDETMAFAP